jgi:hypothetical protein
MAQPRGYDKDKHSSLPYVDKEYKTLLKEISDITGLNVKKSAEKAIAELHKLVKSA